MGMVSFYVSYSSFVTPDSFINMSCNTLFCFLKLYKALSLVSDYVELLCV